MRALITIVLAAAFFVAYAALAVAVGQQSTQLTDTATLGIAISGVLYLGWLWAVAQTAETDLAENARGNLKRTVLALLACIPAAFLFVGMLAPPFIVVGSAAFLVAAMSRSGGLRQ